MKTRQINKIVKEYEALTNNKEEKETKKENKIEVNNPTNETPSTSGIEDFITLP